MRYKQCRPIIFPNKQPQFPTLVTMRSTVESALSDSAVEAFVDWAAEKLAPCGVDGVFKHQVLRKDRAEWASALTDKIVSECYGRVLMTSNPGEAWKERVIYKVRGKIFALLGNSKNLRRVVAAVDFSPATLLLMRFLNQTFMQKENFDFTFIHVKTKSTVQAGRQWETFKKIAGFDDTVPLTVIEPLADVASTLMEVVRRQNCGTIIMGKRGLSGVKRWLLGSVSIRVLRALSDQSLFLID